MQKRVEKCYEKKEHNRNWISNRVKHVPFKNNPKLFAPGDLVLSSYHREFPVKVVFHISNIFFTEEYVVIMLSYNSLGHVMKSRSLI